MGRTLMLDGKTILIVGSTAGIGEAVYRLAASRGASVIGVGRRADRGAALAEATGGRFIATDLAMPGAVAALFATLACDGIMLDGAVNNAALTQDSCAIDETPDAVFDAIFAVNVRAIWQCLAREMASMRPRGGSIVNVASIAGKRGFAGLSVYCASKHAVVGMTRAAALDGAADGVRVNAVLPGTTHTDMLEQQMRTRPGGIDGTIARIPLGRVADPVEPAEAILWLLSDASCFVTGETLTVDGGTTARC
jgi:NAD(P)-dependent dehydrogenase (short-subunit alcohol dehydrogenase family)